MGLRWKRVRHAFFAIPALLGFSACVPDQGYPQSTFDSVTEFNRLLNQLFEHTFWWTMGILVLVEALLIVFIVRYRARPDAAKPRQIHGHVGLEITWTLIPAVIVLFISVPTIRGIFATQPKVSEDALMVEVIGHQWWWEFRYPEYGVITANELYLPVGRNVALRMHSADVVHSFWVPRVGGKRDVNPQPRTTPDERARYNFLQFNIEQPGYYAGQCAEFCGASHAIMRTAIVAVSPQEFLQWTQSMAGSMPPTPAAPGPQQSETTAERIPSTPAPLQPTGAAQQPAALTQATTQTRAPVNALSPTGAPAPGRGVWQDLGPVPPGAAQAAALQPGQPTLEERGRQLFTTRPCVACHTIAGTSARGMLGPNLTRFGTRRLLAAGARPNTLENLVAWITEPQTLKPGALMPGTRSAAGGMPATGLSADEVRAVAAYLMSLK